MAGTIDSYMRQWGCTEDEAHMRLDAEINAFHEAEKYYREVVQPQVFSHLREMKKLLPEHQKREYKRLFLVEEIRVTRKKHEESPTEDLARRLKRLLQQAKGYMDGSRLISEDEIAMARQIDLTTVVPNQRGMVKCPFHHDKTPSLHIHRNVFYCHGCGEKGDTIKFIMKTKGLSFPEAVRSLT